jgi:hypothetical protein
VVYVVDSLFCGEEMTVRYGSADGQEVRLSPPMGDELPTKGFDPGEDTFQAPPGDGSGLSVRLSISCFAQYSSTNCDGLDSVSSNFGILLYAHCHLELDNTTSLWL